MNSSPIAVALLLTGLLTVGCQGKNAIDNPSANPSANPLANPSGNPLANQPSPAAIAIDPTPASTETSPAAPSSTTNQPTNQPTIATLTRIEQGDLQCYLSLRDDQGKTYEVGGSFEICDQQYLDQRVQLTYARATINDCQSNEPCGKTKEVMLITAIQPITDSSENSANSGDRITLSNRNWTITVGNRDSWSGVNGTGNLSYKGCDADGNCLELSGGTITCRDGKCISGWKNGNYTYALVSPITETGDGPTQLLVREGDKVIVDEQL